MYSIKSVFFFILFLTASTLLTAQLTKNNTVAATPKLSAGISLGGTVSNVSSNQLAAPLTVIDFNDLSTNKKWNETFAFHLLYHVNEEYGIESGVFYDKKTIHLSGNNGGANQDKKTNPIFTYEYISIPLLFKKTMGTKKVKATFLAGPYLGLLQSSSFSNKTFIIVRDNNNNFVEIAEEEAFNLNNATRESNFGLLIKVGAEMKATEIITPFIQAVYSRSFSQADDFTDIRSDFPDTVESDGKFSSFGISLGLYFQMK